MSEETRSFTERARAFLLRRVVLIPFGVVVLLIIFSRVRPIPVIAHEASGGPLVREAFGVGTLESAEQVLLAFDVGGRIIELSADQGDRVVAGQVLARLDAAELEKTLNAAQANLALLAATRKRLEAEADKAAAVSKWARAEARRMAALYKEGSVSKSDNDRAEREADTAQADEARARAALEENTQASAAAEAEMGSLQEKLDKSVLHAPMDALVIRREVERGDVVTMNESVFTLVATGEMWVRTWVDEGFLGELKAGQSARIEWVSGQSGCNAGKVKRIGREVDRETHELLVDVVLESVCEQFAVGQRARIWIELARTDAKVRAPREFVYGAGSDSPWVFVKAGPFITRSAVRIGFHGLDQFAIEEGVSPGAVLLRPAAPKTQLKAGHFARVTEDAP